MLCRKSSVRKGSESVPVYLNVYDLTSINGYAYWVGLGVYHSGLQVHGVEYAFGAHEYPTTGIFESEPKQCDGFVFRKSILMGWTEMSIGEVRGVMEELAEKYRGNSYNLITKNCNHFCNDACVKLIGLSIPSWINRLARIGFLCNCIVPVSLNTRKVGHHTAIEDKACDHRASKVRLKGDSKRRDPSPDSSPLASNRRGRSRTRRPLPPSPSPSFLENS